MTHDIMLVANNHDNQPVIGVGDLPSKQVRGVEPMSCQCWLKVDDAVPTLTQD